MDEPQERPEARDHKKDRRSDHILSVRDAIAIAYLMIIARVLELMVRADL